MKNMDQLRDLLHHELQDLHSAEEQIIAALPKMIEKAGNKKLKNALTNHLKVTEDQKSRLDEILTKMDEGSSEGNKEKQHKGILSRILGNGKPKCKGMEGLIVEGEKLMKEDMTGDVMDAAIIGAAQKIEHYEIASYGTVLAYAQELDLPAIELLLKQTLDEEYEADDLLTTLAEGGLNKDAINRRGSRRGKRTGSKTTSPRKTSSASRSTNKKSRSKTKAR